MFDLVRSFHLLAAAVWTGGLIALGALMPAMRRATTATSSSPSPVRTVVVDRHGRRVDHRRHPTRATRRESLQTSFGQRLFLKLVLVAAAIALALGHQMTARRTSRTVRGIIQATTLLVSLAIFAAAVAL